MAVTGQDRIIVAQLAGTARRYARGRELTDAEHDRAVAELVEVASGRPDLLAECAGLAAGFHQGDPDEAAHLQAAQLCIDAGADRELIPGWAEIGRYRAVASRCQPLGRLHVSGPHLCGGRRATGTLYPADRSMRQGRARRGPAG